MIFRKKVAPLFVERHLLNGAEVLAWARDQGLEPNVSEEELHVTVVLSRSPVDWFAAGEAMGEEIAVHEGGPRTIEQFGEAVVLRFASHELSWRHRDFIEAGASWDFPDYRPHVTLRTHAPLGLDLSNVEPFQGQLRFGPERFKDVKPEFLVKGGIIAGMTQVSMSGEITKVDGEQRLAYGWFSVIEEGGTPVVDSQGDMISEDTLVKAVHDFVVDSRAGKLMHKGRRVADIVESVVFTRDVQKALGIDLGRVGWFGAMKFRDDEVWEKVKSGEFRAFSIGGVGRRRMV